MNETIFDSARTDLGATVCRISYLGTRRKAVPALIFATQWAPLPRLRAMLKTPDTRDEQVTCTPEEMRLILGAFFLNRLTLADEQTDRATRERALGSDWLRLQAVMETEQGTHTVEEVVPRKRAAGTLEGIAAAVKKNRLATEAVERFRRRTRPE